MPLYSCSKVVSDDFDEKVDMTLRNWFCLIYWCAKAFLPLAELSETRAACQSSLCSRKGTHVVSGSGFEEPWLHLWVSHVELMMVDPSLAPGFIVSPPTPLSGFFRMVLRTKYSFVIAKFKMNVVIGIRISETSKLLLCRRIPGCCTLAAHFSCITGCPMSENQPGQEGRQWYSPGQGSSSLQAFHWITDK